MLDKWHNGGRLWYPTVGGFVAEGWRQGTRTYLHWATYQGYRNWSQVPTSWSGNWKNVSVVIFCYGNVNCIKKLTFWWPQWDYFSYRVIEGNLQIICPGLRHRFRKQQQAGQSNLFTKMQFSRNRPLCNVLTTERTLQLLLIPTNMGDMSQCMLRSPARML